MNFSEIVYQCLSVFTIGYLIISNHGQNNTLKRLHERITWLEKLLLNR